MCWMMIVIVLLEYKVVIVLLEYKVEGDQIMRGCSRDGTEADTWNSVLNAMC